MKNLPSLSFYSSSLSSPSTSPTFKNFGNDFLSPFYLSVLHQMMSVAIYMMAHWTISLIFPWLPLFIPFMIFTSTWLSSLFPQLHPEYFHELEQVYNSSKISNFIIPNSDHTPFPSTFYPTHLLFYLIVLFSPAYHPPLVFIFFSTFHHLLYYFSLFFFFNLKARTVDHFPPKSFIPYSLFIQNTWKL